MKLRKNIQILLIDPQVDFADPGERDSKGNTLRLQGSLYVPGADHDMSRVADFINRVGNKIHNIWVSLDSHHKVHIANPIYWKNSKGDHPSPFLTITVQDMLNGTWTTTQAGLADRSLKYLQSLEKTNKYSHMIWPPHCLIGSPGHNVFPVVREALDKWTDQFATVDWITKGSNPFTEHFGALQAEVPDANDPGTQLNTRVVQSLKDSDEIIISGIAGSHCVASSIRQVADAFQDDSYIAKFTLLTDTISPVPGCEKLQQDFIDEMTTRGMKTAVSDTYMK